MTKNRKGCFFDSMRHGQGINRYPPVLALKSARHLANT
jgi:hypothetical protein